jgi:Rod binding domain-containing protein
MSDLSVSAVPLNLIKPALTQPASGVLTGSEAEKRAAIGKTSQDFEASFLSNMLGQMFEGISTDGPFGGGQGEAMFRSLMMDSFGKQIAKSGGIGVASAVQREMLKMQGLA